jgi:hypothetical protein
MKKTEDITKEQSFQLDSFIEKILSEKRIDDFGIDSHKVYFSEITLCGDLFISIEEARYLLKILKETKYEGKDIVQPVKYKDDYNNKYFSFTSDIMKFTKSEGFKYVYEKQQREIEELAERKKIERIILDLNVKQYNINTVFLIINATLTLITILLSILIAKGIIEK